MSEIGVTELVLLFVIGLLILGPERLPRVASQIGRWVGRARRTANQLRYQLEREVALEEMKRKPKPRDKQRKAAPGEPGAAPGEPGAAGSGGADDGSGATTRDGGGSGGDDGNGDAPRAAAGGAEDATVGGGESGAAARGEESRPRRGTERTDESSSA